jgi:hypothetical protein
MVPAFDNALLGAPNAIIAGPEADGRALSVSSELSLSRRNEFQTPEK